MNGWTKKWYHSIYKDLLNPVQQSRYPVQQLLYPVSTLPNGTCTCRYSAFLVVSIEIKIVQHGAHTPAQGNSKH
jgi:hypothetical protein